MDHPYLSVQGSGCRLACQAEAVQRFASTAVFWLGDTFLLAALLPHGLTGGPADLYEQPIPECAANRDAAEEMINDRA